MNNKNRLLRLFFNNPLPEGGFQLRQISRLISLAPKSVKIYLKELEKEKLILKKIIHKYPVYFANRDNENFKFFKKLDNLKQIKESGPLDFIQNSCMPDVIILFGSYSKAEDIKNSDIDLFLLCKNKSFNLKKYEHILNRKINLFFCNSFGKLSQEFKNNLVNGIILRGYLKVF